MKGEVKKSNYGTFSSTIFWVLENQVSLCRMDTGYNMGQIKQEKRKVCRPEYEMKASVRPNEGFNL